MFCCGINNYKDFKQYIKNYLRIFNREQSKSPSTLERISEISNEWENII